MDSNNQLSSLPLEVIVLIFQYLDEKSSIRLTQVSKLWREYIWKSRVRVDLSLFRYIIRDEHLSGFLAKIPPKEMKSFRLSMAQNISGSGLTTLTKFKNLVNLDLSHNGMHDSVIKDICCHCNNLQVLILLDCQNLTNKSLKYIGTLHQLQILDISDCTNYSNRGILKLATCTNLKSLFLENCYRVGDHALKMIASLKDLALLSVSKCNLISNESVDFLAGIKHIKSLNISGCYRLKGSKLLEIRMQTLNYLNVSNIPDLNDDFLASFSSKAKALLGLNVYGCKGVTIKGINAVKSNLPDCFVLHNVVQN